MRAVRLTPPVAVRASDYSVICLGDLSVESFVDDLGTCRGVVLSRAATILRSIETQPSTGRFVRGYTVVRQYVLRATFFFLRGKFALRPHVDLCFFLGF